MEQKSEIEITQFKGGAVVAFRSASLCDVEQLCMISKEIDGYVGAKMPRRLVVDFDGVKFFSSQVLGILLQLRSRLIKYGGLVVISGINPQLYRVFKITNLEKIFEFYPDRQSAVVANNSES
ncbi:MAG: STAS domain-containing protein [Phycisphaerae bacterium]|nr:STAS domain-containing protein [Phycisphaerae bacterium]